MVKNLYLLKYFRTFQYLTVGRMILCEKCKLKCCMSILFRILHVSHKRIYYDVGRN